MNNLMLTGRESILLLRDIFNIKQDAIRKIVITAEVDKLLIMEIESFSKLNKYEISKTDLKNSRYEITIKKIARAEDR